MTQEHDNIKRIAIQLGLRLDSDVDEILTAIKRLTDLDAEVAYLIKSAKEERAPKDARTIRDLWAYGIVARSTIEGERHEKQKVREALGVSTWAEVLPAIKSLKV